jgi:mannose-1-phosphate guanylyltransferase
VRLMTKLRISIIPIGGVGSRLYPLTVDTSKAMVRFLNRPLLEHIVTMLALQGIRVIYMGVSGYHNYVQVYDYFGSGRAIAHRLGYGRDEFRIRYMPNIISRGNAEAVYSIIKYYKIDEPVLITQCDNIFDGLDLEDLGKNFEENKCDMTIVLYELENIEEVRRFGVAELRDDGTIARFVEKPKRVEEVPSRLINTGIYVIDPQKLVEFLEERRGRRLYENGLLDFGRHVIPTLIEDGYRVCGYVMKGAWFDIGTHESYMHAIKYFLRHGSPEILGVDFVYGDILMLGRSELSREAQRKFIDQTKRGRIKVKGPILVGRHTAIGENVLIAESVIDNYVVISDDVIIENSVIMDRGFIGKGVRIRNSIIGRHVRIDDEAVIENSIIGNNVFIGRNARVIDSKIWPGKYVPSNVTFTGLTIV